MEKTVFSENTRIIYNRNDECVTSCFRRIFNCNSGSGMLRIAAKAAYVLYINGKKVLMRELKSYDFHKYYDEMDISRYLICGENVLAIESMGAFIAEIYEKDQLICKTDEAFRCKGNASYRKDTVESLFTLGIEEWYDSRKEIKDWMQRDFDDTGWAAAALVDTADEWSGYTKYKPDLLTWKPKYGKQVTAELLCKRASGEKMRLLPTAGGFHVYVSEITCDMDTEIRILVNHASPRITIDGKEYVPGQKYALEKGKHFLCLSDFSAFELLIDLPGGHLSGEVFCGEKCQFAGVGFPEYRIIYHFYETNDAIREKITEADWFHQNCSVKDWKERYALLPVKTYGESVLADVMFQELYLPDGGECPPELFIEKTLTNVEVKTPFANSKQLLESAGGFCEIRNESEYDALFVLDLGKETCGHVSFAVEAEEGQILDIQCFEVIDKGGAFIMNNYNGFRYIARSGYQEFTSFTRYGFRYLMVMVRNKGTVKFHDIHVEETIYPVSRKGTFLCDDNNLNQIYEMCLDTSSLCMLDTYVDCPGHEQAFWVGDADITGKNNILHFGEYDFNQHCLSFAGQSVTENYVKRFFREDPVYQAGKYMTIGNYSVRPSRGNMLPMWTFLWIQQIWEHYLYSGRKEDLAENYEYLKVNLKNMGIMSNSRGLLDIQDINNLIEWSNNDLPPYGEVTASNIMLVNSYRIAAKAAGALGLEEEKQQYQEKAEKLYQLINQLCWNEEKQAYIDTVRDAYAYERYCEFCREKNLPVLNMKDYLSCERVSEQTNTLALLYDCVPEERKQSVLKVASRVKDGKYFFGAPAFRTVGEPKEGETRDGIVMVGSPFFLYFSLGVLWKYNMSKEALRIVRKEWGYMLEKGINTCWETMEMEGRMYTRSICHAWSAGPSIYLTEEVLGLKPVEAGYRKFTIQPQLCDLNWAKGSVVTPYGNIYVEVRKQADGSLEISCQAPKECVRCE